MKFIISEDKIYDLVMKHLNGMFDVENIHWTYGTDDEGDEVDYAAVFYEGDFGDNEDLFRWYGEDYWYREDIVFYKKDLINKLKEESPTLEFENTEKKELLDNIFGDRWHQPFKDWFIKNFEFPIKTIK